MPVARFEMPDGRVARFEVPEGTTPEQAHAMMAQAMGGKANTASGGPGAVVSALAGLGKGVGNVALGAQHWVGRGLQGVGASSAGDWLVDDAKQGRGKLAAELAPYNQSSPWAAGGGELAGEIISTLPVGGAIAKWLMRGGQAAGVTSRALPAIAEAIGSGGMKAGGLTGWSGAGVRAAGGAINGGVTSGLVDPGSLGVGATVGAVSPFAIQGAGKVGQAVYNRIKAPDSTKGQLLAKAMGVPEAELAQMMLAAGQAPRGIVDGSDFTLAQALQYRGAKNPNAALLERIVAGGPGGNKLLQQYTNQGEAQMLALRNQGAETFQGAAAESATSTGNKLGSILRTQSADEREAVRQAWEATYGRAAREGVHVRLPFEGMNEAMSPLGRGSVGVGSDANAVMRTAREIGTDEVPAFLAANQRTGAAATDRTLGQAVRAAGIHPNELSGDMSGEIKWLRESLKGGRGLVNKNGKSLDHLSERMYEAGYLDSPDPMALLSRLSEEAQGVPVYSRAVNAERLAYERAGGEMPAQAGRITEKAVPFAEFQRLRRDSGALGAKHAERAGGGAEAGVLRDFERLLNGRVDDAASGNLLDGERMTQGFADQYNNARGMTRGFAERYKGGNNIAQVMRKPTGQDFTLTGDEITSKFWHGGSGLAGDVSNLKNVLSGNNYHPAIDALRGHVMTDAASRTTAGGLLGAGFPAYVEKRMPGLQELMGGDQLNALTSVAADVRNRDAAAAIPGLLGSDTAAKMSRAMSGGLLDTPIAKRASGLLSIGGVGGESVRSFLAERSMQNKGQILADLFSDPRAAAAALQDRAFTKTLDLPSLRKLQELAARSTPLALTGPSSQQ